MIIQEKVKSRITSLLIATMALVLSAIFLCTGIRSVFAAGSASINFSSASSSFTKGSTFSVDVTIDTASVATTTAQVIFSYDTTKLQVTNLSSASEPYETQFGSATTGGQIDVTRASLNGNITGSNRFMRVTFKALTSGTTNLALQSTSSVLKADDSSQIWNESLTTANYTISDPPSAAPPSQPVPATPSATTSTPTPSGSPSAPPQPDGAIDNIESNPPAGGIIDVQPEVSERKLKKVAIKLRTMKPVRAKIIYGVDGQLSSSSQETELTSAPEISLDPALLVPGRTYSYKVILTDADGAITETDTQTFRAKGYRLKIIVKNEKGDVQKRTKIILRSEQREGTTDDNGEVIFDDVELGDHTAYYTLNGNDQQHELSIIDNSSIDDNGEDTIPTQLVEIVATSTSFNMLPVIVSLLVLSIFAIGGYSIYKKIVSRNNAILSSASTDMNYQHYNQTSVSDEYQQKNDDAYLKPEPLKVNTIIKPSDIDNE